MKIHQVSVNYLPEQDRVLVRFNTTSGEELRVWLTRRLCLGLWPTVNEAVAQIAATRAGSKTLVQNDMAKRMVADFQKDNVLKNSDFKTPYRETPTTLPLGETPLLLTDLQIVQTPESQLQMRFDERLPGQTSVRGFQINMEESLMHGFVHLLESALKKSDWGISLVAEPENDTEGDHTDASDDKPVYLN